MVQEWSLVCIVGHVSFWNAGFSLQGVMGDPPVGRVLPQKLWEGPICRDLKNAQFFHFHAVFGDFCPPVSLPQNAPPVAEIHGKPRLYTVMNVS